MEESFRRAHGVRGPLSPEQMGELMVTLKRAIRGEFQVVEANQERILLHASRCPFGEEVMAEPALCQMTRSVFGGIAARNSRGGEVKLEERIAIGDPRCVVEVRLVPDASPPDAATAAS
jgi:predicted ArsR family transcriptional regulator